MTGIREATGSDRAGLLEQFHLLNVYEATISPDRTTDPNDAAACLDAAWRDVRETNGAALVALQDGKIVGHLFLVIKTAPPFIRREYARYGYVSELFIREHARGQGLAKALLAEAERRTAERGLNRLAINVLIGNTGAESLYISQGFTPQATELMKTLKQP